MWRRLLFPAGTRSLFRTCKPMHPISAFPGVARPSRTTSTIPESEKTIYSLSSGAPRSAVAIVRISGPRAHQALEALSKSSLPEMRRASVRTLYHPKSGAPLDKALVLAFRGPQTFTGEDMVELHVHGGRAIIQSCLDAIHTLDTSHYRLAERGEFTKRAFENNKMDLTEAEGLNDLINAETEFQRLQAFGQMSGRLGQLYESWRSSIIENLAHLEAIIDFGDDIALEEEAILTRIASQVQQTQNAIREHLSDHRIGQRIRDGVRIAIIGAPNAGKSSLLNLLADRPAAIVSPVAGTTRDVIEVDLDLGGYPVTISDTAGIRDSLDIIEQEGVRRANEVASRADLRLFLFDATESSRSETILPKESPSASPHDLFVWNKMDLMNRDNLSHRQGDPIPPEHRNISCKTSEGISDLISEMTSRVASIMSSQDRETPFLTRERHRQHLSECLQALEEFHEDLGEIELASESLRQAALSIGRITGRVDVEDVLDVLFAQFCIGK